MKMIFCYKCADLAILPPVCWQSNECPTRRSPMKSNAYQAAKGWIRLIIRLLTHGPPVMAVLGGWCWCWCPVCCCWFTARAPEMQFEDR